MFRGDELVVEGPRSSFVLARRLLDAGMANPRPAGTSCRTQDVTIVAPVRNRAEMLQRLLQSLAGGPRVVVVDDGSDNDRDRGDRIGARRQLLTSPGVGVVQALREHGSGQHRDSPRRLRRLLLRSGAVLARAASRPLRRPGRLAGSAGGRPALPGDVRYDQRLLMRRRGPHSISARMRGSSRRRACSRGFPLRRWSSGARRWETGSPKSFAEARTSTSSGDSKKRAGGFATTPLRMSCTTTARDVGLGLCERHATAAVPPFSLRHGRHSDRRARPFGRRLLAAATEPASPCERRGSSYRGAALRFVLAHRLPPFPCSRLGRGRVAAGRGSE